MQFCTQCDNMYFYSVNDKEILLGDNNGPAAAAAAAATPKKKERPAKKYFYPGNKLSLYCRHCGHKDETASSGCIYERKRDHESQKIRHLVNEYTRFDITLPRVYHLTCPNASCASNIRKKAWLDERSSISAGGGGDERVFDKETEFRDCEVIYIRYDDENLKYVYVCTHCPQVWRSK